MKSSGLSSVLEELDAIGGIAGASFSWTTKKSEESITFTIEWRHKRGSPLLRPYFVRRIVYQCL
jgi:hypothetical protein